jgi:hypothetical protein
MGQYQQWLHYREVDQQLRSQLEILERELAQLQDRARSASQSEQVPQDAVSSEADPSEQTASNGHLLAENKIIHALAASLNGRAPGHSLAPPETPTPGIEHAYQPAPGTPGATISSAPFAWSNLPNFENPALPVEAPPASSQPFNQNFGQPLPPLLPLPPIPHISHQEMALLPEDMASFIDEHSLTDPQIELPWWLRNIAAASRASQFNGLIDQESVRTNRLVQRWLERWGRQPSQPGSREENNNE